MKRLEFIDRVVANVDFDISKEDVERVLDVMEDLGMVPPDVCRSYESGKFYDSKKHAAHFHMGKDLHYWEEDNSANESAREIVVKENPIKDLAPIVTGKAERINVPEEPKEHIVGLPGLQFDHFLDMKANNEERRFGEEMSEEDLQKHFKEAPKANLPVKRLNDMSMDEIKDWEKAQDNSTDIYKIAARVKNLARGGNAALTAQGDMLCNTYVHVMKSFYDFASTIVDNATREELIQLIRSHENMPGNLIAAAGVGVKKK